jgi:purine-binding chemotaxis protein CheW
MQTTREETNRKAERREAEQNVQQYLTFLIGGEEYGITLLKVKEIIEYDTVTAIPQTPEWVRGVINLRGNVVPVIDLATKFRLAPSVPGKLTCIVITEVQGESEAIIIGVMTDSVRQVIDLEPQEIEIPPSFGTPVKVDYLLGMARSGKKFCLLLDTEKVLSTQELLELKESQEGTNNDAPTENVVSPSAVLYETRTAPENSAGEANP